MVPGLIGRKPGEICFGLSLEDVRLIRGADVEQLTGGSDRFRGQLRQPIAEIDAASGRC